MLKESLAVEAVDVAEEEATQVEKVKEQYSVLPYDKYKFKTPLEYLDEAKTGKVISSEKCEKYTCQVIQYAKLLWSLLF